MVIDFHPFFEMHRDLERIFDDFSRPTRFSQRTAAYPPLNISEDDANLYVRCETPGVAIEDMEITFADGSLAIKGERKGIEGRSYRQERPTGLFQRLVRVNAAVDAAGIKASLANGILTVTLPKAEEAKPRTISIAAG